MNWYVLMLIVIKIFVFRIYLSYYTGWWYLNGISIVCTHVFTFCSFILFIYFKYWFMYWLCCMLVAACGLSLVLTNGGCSSLCCMGFSSQWLLLLHSTASSSKAAVIVAHGLPCSAACVIFPNQRLSPSLLHGRQILNHWTFKEAPIYLFIFNVC